jgi:hypothetical protein
MQLVCALFAAAAADCCCRLQCCTRVLVASRKAAGLRPAAASLARSVCLLTRARANHLRGCAAAGESLRYVLLQQHHHGICEC